MASLSALIRYSLAYENNARYSSMLSATTCKKARLSRDARFDGLFFTAVKTTGIYCRPICPATTPKEENVIYFFSAIAAANAGYRPCLRCRPDSAPGSPAWEGVNTTLERAIQLIGEGALEQGSLPSLCEHLGISDRYLRQLFKQHLGLSPKAFALYQQCLFAKQLLHQTTLPITQVALASGFKSVRRFNDYFQRQLQLTPSQIRKKGASKQRFLRLSCCYRPPYHWQAMQRFLQQRAIPGLEWVDTQSYGRTFDWAGASGWFTARHKPSDHQFEIELQLDNMQALKSVVYNIRRVLDLDVDIRAVDRDLQKQWGHLLSYQPGVRLPGIWTMFEAGIRAILGQQISVAAARTLITQLVSTLGEALGVTQGDQHIGKKLRFPSPQAIVQSDLGMLKIPGSRKRTLHNLAQHYIEAANPDDPQQWLLLKGIGPWTTDYARLRGLSDPDIYLGGDLGIKKSLEALSQLQTQPINPDAASPWRSYLTLHLWSQL